MNIQTLELDLSKEDLGGNVVRVGQGDKQGTTIKAYIYDGGESVALAGYTAFLEVLLPNKRNYYRQTCTVSGNVVTAVLDETKLCCVAGYTDEAYFTFEKDGQKYSTERFAIDILRCVTDGMQPAATWDNAIDDLISRGNSAVSAANNAAAAANSAASAANNAASSASSAASDANAAAKSANDAAAKANASSEKADKAASGATAATDAANKAAKRAEDAADDAGAAANDAREAALRALRAASVGGGGGSGGADSDEVEQLEKDTATLARALAEVSDKYVVIRETCFVPSSRYQSFGDGLLKLDGASFAKDIITLV